MSNSYQVQINGLSGAWHAVAPAAPHEPHPIAHLGDHWHPTLPDAQAHAEKMSKLLTVHAVRIIHRDAEGSTTVVQTLT